MVFPLNRQPPSGPVLPEDPPPPGAGQVKSQQMTGPTTISSAAFEPVNGGVSNPNGNFPDVVIDVTPGSKVIVQFVAQVSSTAAGVVPAYRIDAEDGAGNGFNPIATQFVDPVIPGRPIGTIQAEYVAAETQQTIRTFWQSSVAISPIAANPPNVIGPFHIRVEEVAQPAP